MRYNQVFSMNSFSEQDTILKINLDPLTVFRGQSKGFQNDPPARLHPNIMFGAGVMLTDGFIQKHKITHIINCAFPQDCPEWVQKNFEDKYVCLQAIDSLEADITKWYPMFAFFMDQFLKDNKCEMIYVHCQAGINRSGFLTLLYCCDKFEYAFIPTCKSIVKQRPCALRNYVFFQQVRKYILKT